MVEERSDVKRSKSRLEKLIRKAEICRYAHSQLNENYELYKSIKEFSIVLLSLILSILIGAYFRNILQGELLSLIIFIVPSIVVVIQTLDTTVFGWTNRAARHQKAVQKWGGWIREAGFLEDRIDRCSIDIIDEKLSNIQEKYIDCMDNTPQIPNRKFRSYKRGFREHLLRSKEVDNMSLDDIEADKKRTRDAI